MTKQVIISLHDIIAEVVKTTGYAGSRAADPSTYQRISVTPGEEALLRRFWQEAVGEACHALRRILRDFTIDSDTACLQLGLSEAVDPPAAAGIGNDIANSAVNAVLARWLVVTGAGDPAKYETAAAALLDSAVRKAYTKRSPTRHTPRKAN